MEQNGSWLSCGPLYAKPETELTGLWYSHFRENSHVLLWGRFTLIPVPAKRGEDRFSPLLYAFMLLLDATFGWGNGVLGNDFINLIWAQWQKKFRPTPRHLAVGRLMRSQAYGASEEQPSGRWVGGGLWEEGSFGRELHRRWCIVWLYILPSKHT